VARVAWSYRALGSAPQAVVDLIGSTLHAHGGNFSIQDLSTTVGALAELEYAHDPILPKHVCSLAMGRLAELPQENLSEFAKAMAVWTCPSDLILLELLVCAEAKRPLEGPVLANILAAFARAKFYNATSFVARELPLFHKTHHEFTASDLSKLLWASAVFLGSDQSSRAGLASFVGRASVVIEQGSSDLTPRDWVRVAWSLAALRFYDPGLFHEVATALEKRLRELTLSEVAELAWAFASMNHSRNSLFDQLAILVEQRHGDFSIRDLASILWALAACGYHLRFKSDLVLEEKKLRTLKPSESARLCWALVKLRGPSLEEHLITSVTQDVQAKLTTFSPSDLAMATWALAVLGRHGDKVNVCHVTAYQTRMVGHSWLPSRFLRFRSMCLKSRTSG
jgi:hypothetical protein